MENFNVKASTREQTGKQVKGLRGEGLMPAVLYGHNVDSQPISVKQQEMEKIYQQAGATNLIDLSIDEKEPVKVLVHDVQYDPIKHTLSHVDFYQVNMKEKIETEVPLVFVGSAPAVKELNGTLVHALEELPIRCLPTDLIHEISVDVTPLNTFDDSIHVEDLQVPDTIEIVGLDGKDVVATVTPPRVEEEEPVVKPEEGEEGAEGEEAKEGEEKKEGDEKKEEAADKKEGNEK